MSDFLDLISKGHEVFEGCDPSTLTIGGTDYVGTSLPLQSNESLEIGYRNKRLSTGISLRKVVLAIAPAIGLAVTVDGVDVRVESVNGDSAVWEIMFSARSK